jgi:hypothetical protein
MHSRSIWKEINSYLFRQKVISIVDIFEGVITNGLLGLREFETREKEEKVAISLVWNIQET